jgi:AcrR family transcriptional regulator
VTAPRRTQAERREATRAKLIEATIGLLVERGWAATTSVEVVARAGLTRGAFHHHFASLPELFGAALQAIYDDLRELATRRAEPPQDLRELIDALYRPTTDPRFKAVIEAWLAMANDADLRAQIEPVVRAFATLLSPERRPPDILGTPAAKAHYHLAREAILGLALGRATSGGRPLPHEAAVVERLRATCP